MPVVVNGTANTVTAQATSAPTVTIALNAIGEGQTWQDFTGIRAASTTYTNSTGESISISIQVITGSSITVGGVVAATSGVNDANNYLGAIVPNGSTYSAAGSISRWSELRG